jgi:hypothetical protein
MINKPTKETQATSFSKYAAFLPEFDILSFVAICFQFMIQTLTKLHEGLFWK